MFSLKVVFTPYGNTVIEKSGIDADEVARLRDIYGSGCYEVIISVA